MSERPRILVTGGAKGIGAAIVRMVARNFDVVFTYRSSGDEALALAADVKGTSPGVRVTALPVDLADKAAVDTFAAALGEHGPFYGLIHNAGQPYDTLSMMMAQDKAEAAMQVNFWSFTRLVNALARPMMAARTGRIIAVGSITATRANQGNAAYAASKAALEGYMRTLAIEVAKRGVTVNTLAPGFVDTDMMAGYAAYRDKMASQIPAARFATPDDVASVASFLLSPGAAYVTGTVIPIDGGMSASMGLQR